MKKKWEFFEVDDKKIDEISQKHNISKLLARVLINRNITDEEDINIFLNPTRNDFHDPYLMPDMKKAVDRIDLAIKEKQKIIIYGDYDVDGITSITVLKRFLEERGIQVDYYVPNRLQEGYGLNKDAITKIAKDGHKLMITVDCGISGIEEIEYSNSLGIETIITDHHEPLDELPNAIAVIDAKRKDNQYPFRGLAGVGVVFKLIQAIGIRLNLEEKEYLKYLDIVCVGTISDIVPLIDENRVIASLGLKLIQVTRNVGLKSLLKVIGYKNVNSMAVSFGIAPRINACGRMGFQGEALKLFLTDNIVQAEEITEKLNGYNIERQAKEKIIFDDALQTLQNIDMSQINTIVLAGVGWHHGVIGIVASKLTEKFFKPTILLSLEDDIAKGSGRSIPGFDLHSALCATSNYLEKYGGHEMAVGLSLKKENLDDFKNAFDKIAKDYNIKEIIPVIYVDSEITADDLNKETVEQLNKLEPYGEANKTPIFLYKNLKIDSIRALSEGKHLKMTLKDNNCLINAIGFNMGNLVDEYLIGDKVDIIGTLEINSYNGIETIQINLKDIMKSI